MTTNPKWTPEEDATLIELLSKNSTNLKRCFINFASQSPIRTPAATSLHWYNVLRKKQIDSVPESLKGETGFGVVDKEKFHPYTKNIFSTYGAEEVEIITEPSPEISEEKRNILERAWRFIRRLLS